MAVQLSLFDDRPVMINRGFEKLLALDFNGAREEFTDCISTYPGSSDLRQEMEIADFFIKEMACIRKDIPVHESVEEHYSVWERFEVRVQDMEYENKTIIQKLRKSYFKALIEKMENNIPDGCLFFNSGLPIGLIYLFAGELVRATKLFQETILKDPHNAGTYAYLGDSYYLRGETDLSRVCYREAFSINPHQIDLMRVQDHDIHVLKERLEDQVDEPLDWLPVYARIEGLFREKELRSFDDLKIVMTEYENLAQTYAKMRDERSKAAFFYRAMVLSDNHRMLKFTKRINITEIRDTMKRIDERLFKRYMEEIADHPAHLQKDT
ncbi:MAG: hypothetical protein SVY10_12095 [Thermodesulfobacteriota bacterium]|nr:hypothetical protein [Thermodesulfobacteriota bacterium]